MGFFHPNADDMHGFTVCITTTGPATYVGRWMQEEAGKIQLVNVSVHIEGESEGSRDDFVKKTALWGVDVTHPEFIVERETVSEVKKLGEIAKEIRGW